MLVKISQIKIGERIRSDSGDLESLVNSIQTVGLIHPISLNENNELLSGYRRLLACKKLGWEEIDAKIIQLDGKKLDQLHYEYHENIGRKNLSFGEVEHYKHAEENLIKTEQRSTLLKKIIKIWEWIKNLFTKKTDE